MHKHTHAHKLTYTYAHINTFTHTLILKYTHTYTHMYIHSYTQTHIHSLTYSHTYTHFTYYNTLLLLLAHMTLAIITNMRAGDHPLFNAVLEAVDKARHKIRDSKCVLNLNMHDVGTHARHRVRAHGQQRYCMCRHMWTHAYTHIHRSHVCIHGHTHM